MGRRVTALAGAVVGLVVGLLLLVLTHPTSAYTNDAYRGGATTGFLMRYAALGLLAALLTRALRGGRRSVLAGIGLVLVLALAVLPPALDSKTESEKRRSAAVAIDDPAQRKAAESRAGSIDGCVESTQRELKGTPEERSLDPDAYCVCLIDTIIKGPEDDSAQLEAVASAIRSGNPSAKLKRAQERCATRALTE